MIKVINYNINDMIYNKSKNKNDMKVKLNITMMICEKTQNFILFPSYKTNTNTYLKML